MTSAPPVAHPAKFGEEILAAIVDVLTTYPVVGEVLDPMAGTGRIHLLEFLGYETVGVELEPEWAAQHPRTQVGNAEHLPSGWNGRFGAVITSPPYANRMADRHEAKECCRQCEGPGIWIDPAGFEDETCPRCKGAGRNAYKRNTYRHVLGRPLTEGSAAGMQWGSGTSGDVYRQSMSSILRGIYRVLAPGGLFILNVKDHYRKGELQHVPEWFEAQTGATSSGFRLVEKVPIPAKGNRQGRNGTLRADCEWLLVFRKDGTGSV